MAQFIRSSLKVSISLGVYILPMFCDAEKYIWMCIFWTNDAILFSFPGGAQTSWFGTSRSSSRCTTGSVSTTMSRFPFTSSLTSTISLTLGPNFSSDFRFVLFKFSLFRTGVAVDPHLPTQLKMTGQKVWPVRIFSRFCAWTTKWPVLKLPLMHLLLTPSHLSLFLEWPSPLFFSRRDVYFFFSKIIWLPWHFPLKRDTFAQVEG